MRVFVKVIVERDSPDHWSAWFADHPELTFGSETPGGATAALLDRFGDSLFDPNEPIVNVAEAVREGHLEFMVALKGANRIPLPSVN